MQSIIIIYNDGRGTITNFLESEYDHDMMIMHMLHNGHGHGVALFGREINICNTVITPFTGEGRV